MTFSLVWHFTLADFTSLSFELENPINFIGGGNSTSASFEYISTTGQTVQGQSTSLNFGQNAGFLYFPDITVTPTPAPEGGGGGGGMISDGLFVDCRIADFNCDHYVNIFDLSILLYYVDKSGPEIEPYDLSKSGSVGITDISIVFYYWDDEV